MSHSKVRRFAVRAGFTALCLTGAAQAAELTLYEHPQFSGAQVTLRGHTANVSRAGFNDRTSSLVIDSGRWEVCTDVDFKGTCVTLNRGEYPTLDRSLNDRISSAREVGSYGDRRGAYRDWDRGQIELFGRPGFAGRNLVLEKDAASLAGTNFDDRASSVVVTKGTWQLCSQPEFRGECRVYAPGRYENLGYGMAREVSSARLVRPLRDAPAVVSPGLPPAAAGPARAVLFSERGLRGLSLAVSGPVPELGGSSFADTAASMIVESGTWTVCRHTYFRGDCRSFGPGRYDTPDTANFLRLSSSIRPGGGASPAVPPAATPAQKGAVVLYSDAEFRGDRVTVDNSIADLTRANFNDRAESVVVHTGTWEICTDAGYAGSCSAFAPGSYPRIGGFGRQVSSLRRLR